MARGSEVRARMIDAGAALLARTGYGITMLEVVAEAGAPRGSIYYHFPNGKEELAIAAAEKTGSEIELLIAAKARRHAGVTAFLESLIEHHARRLVASSFCEGCPIMGIIVSAASDSAELRGAAQSVFALWIGAIQAALQQKGLEAEVSGQLATATVAAIEGATVLSRASRSREPFNRIMAMVPMLVAGATAHGERQALR